MKRMFGGEYVSSRKYPNMVKEIMLKASLYNMFVIRKQPNASPDMQDHELCKNAIYTNRYRLLRIPKIDNVRNQPRRNDNLIPFEYLSYVYVKNIRIMTGLNYSQLFIKGL